MINLSYYKVVLMINRIEQNNEWQFELPPHFVLSHTVQVIKRKCHIRHCFIHVPSNHVKSGHHRLASETPSKWRFANGPIAARDWMLAVLRMKKCEIFNRFNVIEHRSPAASTRFSAYSRATVS